MTSLCTILTYISDIKLIKRQFDIEVPKKRELPIINEVNDKLRKSISEPKINENKKSYEKHSLIKAKSNSIKKAVKIISKSPLLSRSYKAGDPFIEPLAG